MALCDWMVPDSSDDLEFYLHSFAQELHKEYIDRGESSIIQRCLNQARLIRTQEVMINRASRRIAELEVALAAASQPSSVPRRRLWLWPAKPMRQ
jgi:hypothetical protein